MEDHDVYGSKFPVAGYKESSGIQQYLAIVGMECCCKDMSAYLGLYRDKYIYIYTYIHIYIYVWMWRNMRGDLGRYARRCSRDM